MNNNLLAILIFLLVLVSLFWIMSDKAAKRVTKSLTLLLQVLPITKIMEAMINSNHKKKIDDVP